MMYLFKPLKKKNISLLKKNNVGSNLTQGGTKQQIRVNYQ